MRPYLSFKKTLYLLFICISLAGCATNILTASNLKKDIQKTSDHSFNSPNGKIKFELDINANQQLIYRVSHQDKIVIHDSRLGLIINNQTLGQNPVINKMSVKQSTQEFEINGNYKNVTASMNIATYQVQSANQPFELEVSASNQGVALRYRVQNLNNEPKTIQQELTQFNLDKSSTLWSAEDYEAVWQSNQLTEMSPKQAIAFPLLAVNQTAQNQQEYVLITQAKHHNYGAVHLHKTADNQIQASLNQSKYYDKSFTLNNSVISPWRVIMINHNLNDLVNNSLVYQLADPVHPTLKNADWIKPGRSGWAWVSGGFKGQNYQNMMDHLPYLAQLGWEYLIVDDGWEHWQNKWQKIESLCEAAAQYNVKILLWKPTGDYQPEWQRKKFGFMPKISGIESTQARQALFKKAKSVGVAGFKVDFIGESNLDRINFYQQTLEDAARYQLVINFHGSNLPTGLDRTYPNELTRESVRGLEFVWKTDHLYHYDTILPFTRYVVGTGDYTPFLGQAHENAGSRAHQLATAITINSPLNAFAVHPKVLVNLPEFELLKSVPTTWDQTRVLAGSKIGELAILAKQKANTWYIGAVNGKSAQKITIHLSDIVDKGEYQALIYQDGQTTNSINKQIKNLSSTDSLSFNLQKAGGLVIKLTAI